MTKSFSPKMDGVIDLLNTLCSKPKPKPPFTFTSDGEANFYTVLHEGGWFARVQLNGEQSITEHWDVMFKIIDVLNKGGQP